MSDVLSRLRLLEHAALMATSSDEHLRPAYGRLARRLREELRATLELASIQCVGAVAEQVRAVKHQRAVEL
jgi:hypothetical protein